MDDGRDNHDKNRSDSADHLRDGRNKSSAEALVVERRLSTQTIAQRGLSDGYGNSSSSNNNNNNNNARRRTSGSKNTNGNNSNLIGKKAFEQDFMLSTLKGVANALKSSHRNSLKQSLSSPSYNHRRPTSAISTASTPPASSSSSSSSSSTASTPNSHLLRHSTPSNNGIDLELVSNCSTSSSASSNLSSSNGGGSGADSGNISGRSSTSNNNFNVTMSRDHLSMLDSMRFDQTSDIESIKKDLIRICRENRLEILAHYVSQIG